MRAIFYLVIKTKGKFTGDEAMAFLSHWKSTTSPKGDILIDPETRQIVQNVYMRRVDKIAGKLVDTEFETLGMMNALGQPYTAK
jgi:branched-chain amino acid transport system substrate-binding protein